MARLSVLAGGKRKTCDRKPAWGWGELSLGRSKEEEAPSIGQHSKRAAPVAWESRMRDGRATAAEYARDLGSEGVNL